MDHSDLRFLILMRIFVPLGIVAFLFFLTRKRKRDPRLELGWTWPKGNQKYLWIAGWILWIAISEYTSSVMGISSAAKWVGENSTFLALTGLGMILLAPLAEELVFRGILFARIHKFAGKITAILIPAFLFAVLHRQYGSTEIGLIFIDGLILGLARSQTGSVPVTFAMHAIGNLVAYLQRFPF